MKLLSIPLAVLLLTVFYTAAFAQNTPELPLHINVGSTTPYTTSNGIAYLADQSWEDNLSYGYVDGRTISIGYPIGGTTNDKIYQTQRAGISEYRVGNLESGKYVVALHFAEIVAHKADATVFDVVIEGKLTLDDFDPFRIANNTREYATVRRTVVDVTDGLLDIRFFASVGQSQIAAISVFPYSPDDAPPDIPADVKAIPSFEAVILDWKESSATTISGYHVYRGASAEGPFAKITVNPVPHSRYIELFKDPVFNSTNVGLPSETNWFYQVSAVDVMGKESLLSVPISATPLRVDSSSLPTYQLTISEENLAKLSPDVNDSTRYPGKLTVNGSEYDVEVRYRGQFTRRYAKKSWRIVFVNDSPFPNRTSLDLKAHYDDLTMMRGVLTNQVYRKVGIAPSRTEHALLFVNGEYFGLYTDYERVDENFLERTQRNPNGTIYETLFTNRWNYGDLLKPEDYPSAYEIRTNKHLGHKPIQQLIERINLTPRLFFARSLESAFNVENYLKYYASVIFTGNTDFTRHNVFFVNDPLTDMWEVIPWDPDLTWGNGQGFNLTDTATTDIDAGTFGGAGTFHGPNVLLTQVLGVPQFKSYYCSELGQLATDEYITRELYPLIDGYYESIRVAAYADWRKFGWEEHKPFDSSPERLKSFISNRGAFLRERIQSFCPDVRTLLRINEVAAGPQTIICDADEQNTSTCYDQWLEIYNPTLSPVDLKGMYLTNNMSLLTRFRFEESFIVPPDGQAIVWLDNEPWQGANHADFSISLTDNPVDRTLALVAEDGLTIIDQFTIIDRGPNVFVQRYPDGAFKQHVTGSAVASPGQQNRMDANILSVSTQPAEPAANQEIKVRVEVFPEIEFLSGLVHYQVNGQSQAVPLVRAAYGEFEAIIPSQSDGTYVQYYITVESFIGENLSPASADSGDYHDYLVGYKRPLLEINEISVSGESGVESWFEIYNDENFAVDLSGMYVTNDAEEPRKYMIPTDLQPIQPGGYVVFFANDTPNLSAQHTNFVLPRSNGFVALYDRDETFNQLISSYKYDSGPPFGSLQLCANNTSIWSITAAPTPGYTNSPACVLMFTPVVQQ